ncbi:hypothetical protein C1I95_23645 [Micromonospora craterilacus]|uniref:Uncharacterized protein n=1 Tax=Micromonospora craterilacus TaxID=1655439 RepID=A0A2W2EIN5_9ACTN|nr:hypothetical protein [Micromonospora craterilacus]PZG13450.1 hypothetical protein C1I95_23645 [Micromonospora craterilacus]
MIDDDWAPGEGDVMPMLWWALPDQFALVTRARCSAIPGHPLIAFADEFTSTPVAGPLYVDLRTYTACDTTSTDTTIERRIFQALTDAFPDTFSVVVGRGGQTMWLALRLTRLTVPIAAALLEQHGQHRADRHAGPN